MANEAAVQCSLSITKGALSYQSRPGSFRANVTGTNGPTPGAVTATTAGTNVNLGQLTALGGFCRLMNLDPSNFVTYGILSGGTFYPLGELLPGESYVIRLSRRLLYGSGAGTALVNNLRLVADTASCVVICDCFDV